LETINKKLIPVIRYKPPEAISKPFMEAAERAHKSLKTEFNSFEFTGCGSFLFHDKEAGSVLYLYDLKLQPINKISKATILCYQNGALNAFLDGDLFETKKMKWFISKNLTMSKSTDGTYSKDERPDKEKIQAVFGVLALILLFKKYSKVEERTLKSRQSIKDFNGVYNNNTGIEMKYLTINWWTNITQAEGFNVRGHFRLQPFGKGLNDKKIIWINEFRKEGYHLKARKTICQ
jgi:hypothetical protein